MPDPAISSLDATGRPSGLPRSRSWSNAVSAAHQTLRDLVVVAFLFAAPYALAAPGELDSTFGNGGKILERS
jgi:hypothetical protein